MKTKVFFFFAILVVVFSCKKQEQKNDPIVGLRINELVPFAGTDSIYFRFNSDSTIVESSCDVINIIKNDISFLLEEDNLNENDSLLKVKPTSIELTKRYSKNGCKFVLSSEDRNIYIFYGHVYLEIRGDSILFFSLKMEEQKYAYTSIDNVCFNSRRQKADFIFFIRESRYELPGWYDTSYYKDEFVKLLNKKTNLYVKHFKKLIE